MERYNQCQRIKNRAKIPVEKLKPNAVLEKLQQSISVDFIYSDNRKNNSKRFGKAIQR